MSTRRRLGHRADEAGTGKAAKPFSSPLRVLDVLAKDRGE
jgi:hypothetical protein